MDDINPQAGRTAQPEGQPGDTPVKAAPRPDVPPPTDRVSLRKLVRRTLLAVLLVMLLRAFVLEPYGIPTGSMRPTIVEGDALIVYKLPYVIRSPQTIPFTRIPIPSFSIGGLGHLERGDLVVFEYPESAPRDTAADLEYVKRCVAVAGDTVQLVDGRVFVNGREEPAIPDPEEPAPHRRMPISAARAIPLLRSGEAVVVPFAGFRIDLDSATAELWRPWIRSEGAVEEYRNHIVFVDGLPATSYTFQRDYFFALGDNPSVTRDSRIIGFIPYDNLIGEAIAVYWSHDQYIGIRWNRIGTLLR